MIDKDAVRKWLALKLRADRLRIDMDATPEYLAQACDSPVVIKIVDDLITVLEIAREHDDRRP